VLVRKLLSFGVDVGAFVRDVKEVSRHAPVMRYGRFMFLTAVSA
jgi:hypothetical protein